MMRLKFLAGSPTRSRVLHRVAVDQDQVGQRALLDRAELAGIWIAQTRQRQQFGIGRGRRDQGFGRRVPAREPRSAGLPCCAAGRMQKPGCLCRTRCFDGTFSQAGRHCPCLRPPASSSPARTKRAAPRRPSSPSSMKKLILSQMPFSAISFAVSSSIRWPCSMEFTPAAMEALDGLQRVGVGGGPWCPSSLQLRPRREFLPWVEADDAPAG